jgi:hypothetical protein
LLIIWLLLAVVAVDIRTVVALAPVECVAQLTQPAVVEV